MARMGLGSIKNLVYDRSGPIKTHKSGCELEVMVGCPHKTRDILQFLVIFHKMRGNVWVVPADFMTDCFEGPAKALEEVEELLLHT